MIVERNHVSVSDYAVLLFMHAKRQQGRYFCAASTNTVASISARNGSRKRRARGEVQPKVVSPVRQMSNPLLYTATTLMIAALGVSTIAEAGTIDLRDFVGLSSRCAPHVAVETLAAVARTESGFDALTLHDNSTKRTYHPATRDDAIALGVELITVDEHSVDLGLMQINSANLPGLGLSVADVFEPCRNLAAADRVLVDGYTAPAPGQDVQPSVRQALSRYNTGDPARGLANGYVGRVQASAELVVPALRVQGDAPADQAAAAAGSDAPVVAQPLPPLPPSWDVYARAKAGHSQVFATSPAPAPAALPAVPVSFVAAAPSAPAGPTPAQRPSIEALNDVR